MFQGFELGFTAAPKFTGLSKSAKEPAKIVEQSKDASKAEKHTSIVISMSW